MTQPPDAYDKLIEARLDYLARQRTRNRRAFALVLACVVIALVAAASCDVWRGRAKDAEGCEEVTDASAPTYNMIPVAAREPKVTWGPPRRVQHRGPRVK